MAVTPLPRRWLRSLVQRPAVGATTSRTLELVGFHTLADRLDRVRSEGDLQAICVPAGSDALRSHRFKMFALGGRDQVVRAIRDGGWNGFESPLPTVITALVRHRPDTFFDVGANTGFYSLVAVTADDRIQVHAMEAVPEIATLFRSNVAVNQAGDRIRLHELAVGDTTGTTMLHLPPAQPDGTIETSASLDASFKEQIARRIEVPVQRLDDLWTEVGKPPTSLIKIDVEGAERLVLEGAEELIETCRPVLAVEVITEGTADAAETLRREHRYVDVTLSPTEMVVNRQPVRPEGIAPNHLLVPQERLGDVVDVVRGLERLQVTLLP
jgi:FkbM family methyltransferase